jgi:hypothetical protein
MRKKKKPYFIRLIRLYLKSAWWMIFPHEIKYNPEQEWTYLKKMKK